MSQDLLEKTSSVSADSMTHDTFVKEAMAIPRVATEFFEANLPEEILKIVDLSTLEEKKADFVNHTLGRGIMDMLYSVKFKEQIGYLMLLLEHQSTSERDMVLRIQKYMLSICDAHLTNHPKSKLPPIYPIIFYTGTKKWTAPLSFWELFSDPKLAQACFFGPIQLLNLKKVKHIDLKHRYHSGILLYLMSKIREKDIYPHLKILSSVIRKVSEESFTLLQSAIYYILGNIKSREEGTIIQFFRTIPINKGKIMAITNTYRQDCIQEGMQEGLQQGMQEGMCGVARNMLADNMDIDSIIRFTKLSKKEIEKLKEGN